MLKVAVGTKTPAVNAGTSAYINGKMHHSLFYIH